MIWEHDYAREVVAGACMCIFMIFRVQGSLGTKLEYAAGSAYGIQFLPKQFLPSRKSTKHWSALIHYILIVLLHGS